MRRPARVAERRAAVRRQRLRPDRGRRAGRLAAAERSGAAAAQRLLPRDCRARTRRSAAAGSHGATATRSWSPTPRRSSGGSATRPPAPGCSRCRGRCWSGARATPRAPIASGRRARPALRAPLLALPAPDELGRPALLGTRLLCHVAGPAGSRADRRRHGDGRPGGSARRTRRPAHQPCDRRAAAALRARDGPRTGAAARYAASRLRPRTTSCCSCIHRPAARDREHEPGRRRHRHRRRRPKLPPRAQPGVVDTLWTTALTPDAAYVTRLRARRGAARTADILRVPVVPAG